MADFSQFVVSAHDESGTLFAKQCLCQYAIIIRQKGKSFFIYFYIHPFKTP